MKQKFLKKIVFIIVLSIMCTTSGNVCFAFAEERVKAPDDAISVTVISNEVEYLYELLNSTDEELKKRGLSVKEIFELRNYDYSKDLMRLKEKETIQLQRAGFSTNQIDNIRAYDGQENAVEYAAMYGLSDASLSGKLWVKPLTVGRSVDIWYSFEWSQPPIFMNNDSIGIAWVFCDENSNMILSKVMGEEHNIDYCIFGDDEIVFCEPPRKVKGTWSYAREITYKLYKEIENTQYVEEYFGKYMWGCISARTMAGSKNLSRIMVNACYAHTIVDVEASIEISITDGGIGISIIPSWKQEELYNKCYLYDAEGNLTY